MKQKDFYDPASFYFVAMNFFPLKRNLFPCKKNDFWKDNHEKINLNLAILGQH